jgi:uncharacterized membrane protein YphA (DoxX/SURF4 family)
MKNKPEADWTLRFIGLVFLSAAIYRSFNYQLAVEEFANLKLPPSFVPFVIVLECLLAAAFLFQKKVRYAALTAILFLASAITIAFITHHQTLLANVSELFFFHTNPTDVFLHMVYVGILTTLFLRYRNMD